MRHLLQFKKLQFKEDNMNHETIKAHNQKQSEKLKKYCDITGGFSMGDPMIRRLASRYIPYPRTAFGMNFIKADTLGQLIRDLE